MKMIPPWSQSAWTSARHWLARARLSTSPSPSAPPSPFPLTQGRRCWPWVPKARPRRSQAPLLSGEMPGAEKTFWKRSKTLRLSLLLGLFTFTLHQLLHLIDARWWPWERVMWFHLFPNWMALQVYLHLQHPLPLLPLHLHHSTSPALDKLHPAQVVHRGTSAWAQLIQKQEHVSRLVATTVVENFV